MGEASAAEFEIGINRSSTELYSIELRFTPSEPDGDIAVRVVHGVRFDLAGLDARATDPVDYGRFLAENLFADPVVRSEFEHACDQDADLRLRLFVGPDVPELHRIHWETLRDPRSPRGGWLVTNERILFSRYLSGSGGPRRRSVQLRSRSALSAVVVIANPVNAHEYQLAAIDVEGERRRAEAGLAGLRISALASRGTATLANLVERVRAGCDVLYLVAHGTVVNGQSCLFLEDESGRIARVLGSDLVERLSDLRSLPRLVVLASCRSAGGGNAAVVGGSDSVERALGPLLINLGVPAVVAMQGEVSVQTVERFLPRFFAEVQRNEPIDRAMAIARGSVRDRPDSWMPVLFMRLRTGRLWPVPGFTDAAGFELWPSLVDGIQNSEATPILGPGMHESLTGSRREIAHRWAADFDYPLAAEDFGDLARVAQFLAVNQKARFPPRSFCTYLRDDLLERYHDDLPPALRDAPDPPLLDLIAALGAVERARNPADPHKVLAELPFPIYVTTSFGNLLTEALTAAGKTPQIEFGRWNEATVRAPSVFEKDPDTESDYVPTVQQPLVYHVYGHFGNLDSMVLTEDDYFDYLIGLTRNEELVPSVVNRALTRSSLLFLGFQMDDWLFRVLFRTILSQEGSHARQGYPHVAVQVDPEDDRIVNPRRALRYLEKYFEGASVDVYWGRVEDFVEELQKRSAAQPAGAWR
jgi:hypothetical protein